tara:strand:- start:462 stop:626 length:165 start_codon:yes stop_codon:yes gene_type:complete
MIKIDRKIHNLIRKDSEGQNKKLEMIGHIKENFYAYIIYLTIFRGELLFELSYT